MNKPKGETSKPKRMGLMGFFGAAWSFFAPYKLLVAAVFLALLFQTAFRIFVPLAYREIFDNAIANMDQAYLITIVGFLLVGWVFNMAASLAQDWLSALVGARAMNDVRITMYQHLQRLSEGYFSRITTGDLMSRFSNDLMVVEVAFLRAGYNFLFSAMILVLSVAALFFMEWRLALMTFAALPIALLGPRLLGGKAQKKNYDRKEYEALVSSTLQEAITSQRVVRAFGLQGDRLARFKDQLDRLARKSVNAGFFGALTGRTSSLSVFLVQILIMSVGGYLVIKGFLTAGSLVGFVALLMNVSNAANHISAAIPDLLQAAAGMQRIHEFLAEGPTVEDNPEADDLDRIKREIYFQNIHFAYPGDEKSLNGLNFRIKAGESVALVGPSGCGKSTVLKLIMRFYDPTSGEVFIDGKELRKHTKASVLQQLGIVLQENQLFNTSLLENIRMGDLKADDDAVMAAAKKAEIHDTILTMPEGYQTIVGEGGGKLSGGQRQRIALARAFLRDPAILVLDEATSALDPGTEAAVNKTLEDYGRNRTVISATHRLGAIQNVDRILVLDKGRVVEEGTHEELMVRSGVYFNLWKKQSGFQVSEDGYTVEITPERLRGIPLFHNIKEESLASLAQYLHSETASAKRALFYKGDPGDRFYIIARGQVEVMISDDTGNNTVRWLEDGDYFGEMALLDGAPRNASVRTVTPTLLLTLSRKHFNMLLEHEPELRQNILNEVARRRGQGYAYEEDESWGGGIQFRLDD